MKLHKREYPAAVILLLPTLIGLFVFRLFPIFSGMVRSLFDTRFGAGGEISVFVGLGNYQELFGDPVFWNSLWVTLKFNLLVNPIQIVIAIMLALLLTREKRGEQFFRSIIMITIGMSVSVASIMWQILLNPNQGVVNGFLGFLGIGQQPFFTSARQALWGIIFVASWKGVAFWMVFLIAGLQDIPHGLYEAADIDGTNLLQKIWYITLPLLKRIILFVLVVDTSVNFILFAPMYIITRGGPEGSTNVLMYEAYRSGFIYGLPGRSMAMVTILLFIMLVIVGIQFKFLRSDTD